MKISAEPPREPPSDEPADCPACNGLGCDPVTGNDCPACDGDGTAKGRLSGSDE